ncbi:hypothetical protein E8E14_000933 [Neopestalotiopsis sp. 37M]|nr:hypothetical protein E8E14_000933 [Neopestalotiopsis sp. 37M]
MKTVTEQGVTISNSGNMSQSGQLKSTTDGFVWTPSGGLSEGLPTVGLIDPPTHLISEEKNFTYDAIVVGAGYAGLVAARDLATQGKKTLLLEGRDRLGGRTWNAVIDGFNYELGGTWLHWHMPHIYREISLYGLHNDWIVTQNPGSRADFATLTTDSAQRNLSHEEETAMFSRVWGLFCNVDGNYLRDTYKYPFATGQSPKLMSEWDELSCQDRLDEIRDRLSKEEQAMLIAVIEQMGGNSLDKLGLLDALRWWSLGGNTPTGLNDIGLHTRLASGNSTLHRRIFEHAESTGNLSYSFSTAVERIVGSDGVTTVETRDGRTWHARTVVCTVPLNVLSSIQFSPPLPGEKLEALQQTSANLCNKVHVDLDGPDYLSWSSFGSPGQGLVAMLADRLTPAGNTHLVGFGPDPTATNGMNLKDMSAVKEAVLHLLPKNDRDRQNISRIS